MSARRPAPTRPVPVVAGVLAVLTVLAVALAGLLAPVSAASPDGRSAGTAARATAPAYGPWSSYYYDVRVRVSTPTRDRNRVHVQVQRRTGMSGDRQFRLTWRSSGQAQARVGSARLVGQGGTITLMTAALPCGKSRVTLMGRSRSSSAGDFGQWQSFSALLNRAC